jgi:hypothetical protein
VPLDALFHRDDGKRSVPTTAAEWDSWVSASRTRNFLNDDPLLDWLDRHGAAKGLTKDLGDPRTDFGPFIFRKGFEFETAVMRNLGGAHQVVTISQDRGDARREEAVRRTWDAMCAGNEVIAQAPIWNPQTQTYGVIDLLVRSDILDRLFPGVLQNPGEVAPHIPGAKWHYRVLDIKFSTLDLLKNGHAASGHLHYGAQVWLYNEAVGRLQGWTPPNAYLLGRGWKQGQERGPSALERLSRIDRDYAARDGTRLGELALAACEWVRRVRAEGEAWDVLPVPTVPELRPNMRSTEDAPWHGAKRRIADATEDLTILPRVNPEKRNAALAAGIRGWRDPHCCAARLGITGETYALQADKVIAANHSPAEGPHVFPARVNVNEDLWRTPAHIEFFVDFETVSDLDDDFSAFPRKGGQPLIFMVGLGYLDRAGAWQFEVFTADRLVPEEERRILTAWIERMRALCTEAGSEFSAARMYHWSPAEESFIAKAYNSAAVRHGLPEWEDLPWVDLLAKVVKAQPVTVRGAFGFGLKAVTKAMHAAGLIATDWPDGVADGLGAMVGAWSCDGEARRVGGSMRDLDLMKQIEAYNRVDVTAMRDVLGWLRRNR